MGGMNLTPGVPGPLDSLNSVINSSSTITETAGAQIDEPALKAVMYDGDGNVVLATSGDKAIGVILSATLDPILKGRRVHVLVKNIGLLSAGGAIAKGDLIADSVTVCFEGTAERQGLSCALH